MRCCCQVCGCGWKGCWEATCEGHRTCSPVDTWQMRLPRRHSCTAPVRSCSSGAEYSSKEKLRQKLLLAIGWAQGFGLK